MWEESFHEPVADITVVWKNKDEGRKKHQGPNETNTFKMTRFQRELSKSKTGFLSCSKKTWNKENMKIKNKMF